MCRLLWCFSVVAACGGVHDPTPWQREPGVSPDCSPAAEVVADGVDQDCDGTELCPIDADGDGFGGPSTVTVAVGDFCGTVAGTALAFDDCDDTRADAHTEGTVYADLDGDGYGTPGLTQSACRPLVGWSVWDNDCNDADPTVYPDAPEVPADNVDQSCDGAEACYADLDGDGLGDPNTLVYRDDFGCPGAALLAEDCDDSDAHLPRLWFLDADGDSFGVDAMTASGCVPPAGYTAEIGDCDDALAQVHPGAPETPYDGVDDDCDGADLIDVDHDGFASTLVGGTDCDDAHASVHPGAPEIPYDHIDQDCDGADLVDVDHDGYVGTGAGGDDCDDTSATVHPGATERCADGIDQDCDLTPRWCGLGGERSVDDADVVVRGDRASGLLGFSLAGGVNLDSGAGPDLVIGSPGRRPGGAWSPTGAVLVATSTDLASTPRDATDLSVIRYGLDSENAGVDVAVAHGIGTAAAALVIGAPGRLTGKDQIGRVWTEAGPFLRSNEILTTRGRAADGSFYGHAMGARVAVAEQFLDGTPVIGTVASSSGRPGSDVRFLYPAAFLANPGGALRAGGFDDATRTFRDVAMGQDGFGDSNPDVAVSWELPDGTKQVAVIPNLPRASHIDLDGAGAVPRITWTLPTGPTYPLLPVELIPDVTGDGRADLLVGAPCLTACAGTGGTVWIVPGSASTTQGARALAEVGTLLAGTQIVASVSGAAFGGSVAYAGDLNGDGEGDVIIGAFGEVNKRGAAYVLYGPIRSGAYTSADIGGRLPGAHLSGRFEGGALGFAVTAAGDVDGDGYDDLALAAPWAPGGGGEADAGRVFLWFGGGD